MSTIEKPKRRAEDVRPDPAWYEALGGDELVRRVLDVFYDRAFVDPVLARFFAGSDKATLKGKQAGFMRRCFTGDTGSYMGQRPRNAHHHMVISDAEFDHREALMRQVLAEAGLAPADVERWIATEEVFRQQIVKEKPWPLFYRGQPTYWAEDAREARLEAGSLCDGCQGEVPAGASLWLLGDTALCTGCKESRT